jgi:hypothetical protein
MTFTQFVRIVFKTLDKLLISNMGFDNENEIEYDSMYKYNDHEA